MKSSCLSTEGGAWCSTLHGYTFPDVLVKVNMVSLFRAKAFFTDQDMCSIPIWCYSLPLYNSRNLRHDWRSPGRIVRPSQVFGALQVKEGGSLLAQAGVVRPMKINGQTANSIVGGFCSLCREQLLFWRFASSGYWSATLNWAILSWAFMGERRSEFDTHESGSISVWGGEVVRHMLPFPTD